MSEGLPVSSVTGNLCLNLSYNELVLPALGEQWGLTVVNVGGLHRVFMTLGPLAGPQAVMVVQERDGELSRHPAPWASLWDGTQWTPNEED